jgi:hypothetical protein
MRVAVPWLGYACGDCRYCNSGRETLCESQLNTGYSINGGFAEYSVGYARHVVRVPDGIDPVDVARRRRVRRRRARPAARPGPGSRARHDRAPDRVANP